MASDAPCTGLTPSDWPRCVIEGLAEVFEGGAVQSARPNLVHFWNRLFSPRRANRPGNSWPSATPIPPHGKRKPANSQPPSSCAGKGAFHRRSSLEPGLSNKCPASRCGDAELSGFGWFALNKLFSYFLSDYRISGQKVHFDQDFSSHVRCLR